VPKRSDNKGLLLFNESYFSARIWAWAKSLT
jgi:hypothetical protein